MRYATIPAGATVEQIQRSVVQCLGRLLLRRRLDEAACDGLQAARAMLESLPLATAQFDLACRRLKNAEHYLRYTEPGAARFELKLLAGSLRSDEEGHIRTAQRRRRRS